MESLYKKSVSSIPVNLTDPTPTYKKHVWIACIGIALFFLAYLSLCIWFFYSAYRLFSNALGGGEDNFIGFFAGLAVTFLGIFMIKAFFFIKAKHDITDREVKQADEPVLFDFLYQLADEVGAPRPQKVYLSNRVNASVFYDLSVLNLFFPSKKNLEIGLGLINVLNLGEFKAVLAHEYGHFAQRSMLVGRWVYIANQIAFAIINKRDALDGILSFISRIDIRIAWIGWLLSLIVWSIRSVVEILFRIVIITQRALSREMEFQADLVAVSATGSDALIHALHKLRAADQALSSALHTVDVELANGSAVEDIYALQTNAIQKTSWILNDSLYGSSPQVPEESPEDFRVFSKSIAQPPQMWATHPPDQERELNAKQVYIPAEIDDSSAWDLFSNPKELRLLMSSDLIKTVKSDATILPIDESLKSHNKQYEKSYLDPKYKGIYLSRFFTIDYKKSEELYQSESNKENHKTEDLLANLYPSTLVDDLEDYTTLLDEKAQLEAIHNGYATSSNNGIWHRGVQVQRKELPDVLEQMTTEVSEAKSKVINHDKLCRKTHLELAESLGNGWDTLLKSDLQVIHYAEHSISNLNDAHGVLVNVYSVVTADGRVTDKERRRLLLSCNELFYVLKGIADAKEELVLSKEILAEMEAESWKEILGKFDLVPANAENLSNWLEVIDGWVATYRNALNTLRSEALEVLLRNEERVGDIAITGNVETAPSPSKVPDEYPLLQPGSERPIQTKLGLWDKFATADGFVASAVRFLIGAGIIGAIIYLISGVGTSTLSVYNGFSERIKVSVNGSNIYVAPNSHSETSFSSTKDFEIQSWTNDGNLIESFEPSLARTSKHYVYNIAGAGALVEWTAYYGMDGYDDTQYLGNERWSTTKTDYVFVEPPESLRTSDEGGESKDILTGYSGIEPVSLISLLDDEEQQNEIIRTYAIWENNDSPFLLTWLGMAGSRDDFQEIVTKRAEIYPNEIETIRAQMDNSSEAEKSKLCQSLSEQLTKDPSNSDLVYLAARCISDEKAQNDAFVKGYEKNENHGWLAFASGYIYANKEEWVKAYEAFSTTYGNVIPLKPTIATDLERISRVIKAEGLSTPKDNNLESGYLDYIKKLESGNDPEISNTESHAYYLLMNGELDKAMETAKGTEEEQMVLIYCAASDGAKQEWIESALNIKPEEIINDNNIFSIIGIAIKKNNNYNVYKSLIDAKYLDQSEMINEFIGLVQSGQFEKADERIQDVNLWFKGQLYTMAYIAKGNQIPSSWKIQAKALLFSVERPYIK